MTTYGKEIREGPNWRPILFREEMLVTLKNELMEAKANYENLLEKEPDNSLAFEWRRGIVDIDELLYTIKDQEW